MTTEEYFIQQKILYDEYLKHVAELDKLLSELVSILKEPCHEE